MLSYTKLTKEDFDKLIRDILIKFEKFVDRPYDDNDGNIAIGYGFDLTMHTNETIDETAKKWEEYFNGINFIKTIDFKTILNTQIKVGNQQKTVHSLLLEIKSGDSSNIAKVISSFEANNFILKSEEEGFNLLKKLLNSYYIDLHNHLKSNNVTIDNFKDTYENVALLSLFYNGKKDLVGPGLMGALKNSDRFKAWYEIRYNSNGNKLSGLAKRRMYEGYFFGLYENREANNEILNNKLPSKDMILFSDILNIFQYLNYAGFNSKKKSYTALEYFKYYENNHIYINDNTTIVSNRQAFEKDIPYFLCDDLFKPVHEYVNHLFGNKYTDSQGKIIESFDLDKIFVIDKNTININSKAMQNILNSKISAFNSQKKKDENSGNTIKSETINFLLILKDRNATDIDFGQILSKNEFCSITLVLLEDNAINFNNVSTENLNILCINPQDPSEFKNIKGNFQVENDDDSIISLKSIENGLNAIYKKLEGCLSIFDDLGNKLVDIINHTPGSSKAAIELPELQYSYEVVSNRVNGNFTYICNIELVGKIKNNKEEIVGLPFYLYSSYTDEILETTIQEKDDKLQAVFNFSLDENKLETQKIMCSIDRSELESKRKSNQYPSHASGISKTEQQDGKKEGKYACSTNLRVDKCKIISSTVESVKVEAIYNLNTESEQYQEQIKNTQWCYYITDSYSPNKVPKDEAKGHVLPNKGKIIEVKLNDLDLKYTPDKTIYFFPYLKQPSARVYDFIIGKVINYHVTACKVVTDSDGEFQVEAVYNIKNMVIDEEVNNNTKWLIVAIESHVPTHEHLSILSKYDGLSIEKINTVETDKETNDKYQIPQDYQIENTTGSILNFKLKDNSSWQTKSVYFLPYKSKIDVDIKALWDLSQPFYLKYTGNKLQVINKDGKLEFEKAAYGGQALEQKPESSVYKVHEVTIKDKVYYFHYDKDRQCNKESGVLPEGNYFVDIDGKSVYGFFYDMEKFFLSRLDIYRTSYLDDKNILIKDNVYRDNFYIHGGSTYLDNKGIELAKDFDTFFDELSKYNEQKQAFTINNRTPIRVQVEYEKDGWHDPLDKMEICLFSQGGNYKPWNASFGETREEKKGDYIPRDHAGVDLFAPIGMPVYACLDGVYHIVGKTYGTAYIVVDKDEIEILKNMYNKNYKTLYNYSGNPYKYNVKTLKGELLFGSQFNINSSNFVLRYQHLSSFESKLNGKHVKRGTIIGKTGVTGAGDNNYGPHLHFEIGNTANAGLKYKANPAAFCNIKFPERVFTQEILEQLKGGKSKKILFEDINYLKLVYPYFKEQVEYLLKKANRNDLLLKITGGSV